MNHILILNGPNLNLLGVREPDVYGSHGFDDYFKLLKDRYSKCNLAYLQTNHEGIIIDTLQTYGLNGWNIVLNAGGYTHTSVAIRDAILAISSCVVDVHISNIYERETFRQQHMFKDVVSKSIVGEGLEGYALAIEYIVEKCDAM